MYILGITGHYHDSACALLRDGEIIAVIEEERLNRIKHYGGFPFKAVDFCLKEAGITIKEVEHIGYYFKPHTRIVNASIGFLKNYPRSLTQIKRNMSYFINLLSKYYITRSVHKSFSEFNGNFYYLYHHLTHAASCFFPSPFEKAAILTIDASGEWTSTQLAIGCGNKIIVIKKLGQPNSLGYLYATITQYLGFERNSDEYKVMGLASYGKPKYLDEFSKIISLKSNGGFSIDMSYFAPPSPSIEIKHVSKKFINKFGPPRHPDEPVDERHADIADSLQKVLENTLLHICGYLYSQTKEENLCMAGGIALNCVANAKILESTKFKNLFIQPAAGDPGCAIGAAMYIYHSILNNRRKYIQTSSYFGPSYSNEKIEHILDMLKLKYIYCNDIAMKGAELIADGKIIGWFQGKMEWGPRALGNRSILADPRREEMKDIVNACVKMREPFRPFAPAVLEEEVQNFFEFSGSSPFMLLAVRTKPEKIKLIPAVVHVDGTARIQTVNKQSNPLFYELILQFKKITGIPMVLNTSFNVKGEPIVCTPEDAIRCFYSTGLDYLIIGNYLLSKKQVNEKYQR